MGKYAYLDKGGILHVVDKMTMAVDNAKFNKKVVLTGVDDNAGIPYENGAKLYIYAAEKKFYTGGNMANGKSMTEEEFKSKYPLTYQAYTELI